MTLFFKQIYLLLVEELRELFTRRRVLLGLILYGVVFGFLFYSVAKMQALFINKMGVSLQNRDLIIHILRELRVPDAALLAYEIGNFPALVLVFQLLVVCNLPLLIPFLSNDMLTTDIYRGTLRFLMLRSNRLAYFTSKFLAHVILYIAIVTLTFAVLLFILAFFHNEEISSEYLLSSGHCVLASIPLTLGLVTGTQLVSGICRKPFTALFVAELFWIFQLIILPWFPEFSFFNAKNIIGVILPTSSYGLESALRTSGWALLYFAIGYLIFWRREI